MSQITAVILVILVATVAMGQPVGAALLVAAVFYMAIKE